MKRRMSPWRASFGGHQSGDAVVMASDPSEVMVNHDPTETNEECSGKKKSKFKNLKKFFARKKRKDPASQRVESELTASKSSDNVSKSSGNALSRADKEKGSKVSLGSKALSHDSVFVSDSSEANEALGASQDSIHGKVKSLQLQLKQAIRLGSPPSLMCVKRTEDAGTMSEDDGLPCSPPEYTSAHAATTQVPRDSVASLDCEDEQRSRVESPLVVVSADFSQPASPFSCLDNSAAKHKMGLRQKACNKRKPANRLEVKAECNSIPVKNHVVVPFPNSLDDPQTDKTPDTTEDEDHPHVEEEEREKEPPLPGEEDMGEHESAISHCPDTSGLPDCDVPGDAADLQPLPPDSPRGPTPPPADLTMDLLDGVETKESSEDSIHAEGEDFAGVVEESQEHGVIAVVEDNDGTLEERREDTALSVGEDDPGTEEGTFLEEVLNSLKTPLTLESAEVRDGREEEVTTEEELVTEACVEDETDMKATIEMTGDDDDDEQEEDEEEEGECMEHLKEDEEEVMVYEEEVIPEAEEERGTKEEVKSEEEEPEGHQDVSSSALSCQVSVDDEEVNRVQYTVADEELSEDDEQEEEEEEEEEEEDPEIELFTPYGQDEECTVEKSQVFQWKEEEGSEYSDENVKVEVKLPEEGEKDEQEESVVEQEIEESVEEQREEEPQGGVDELLEADDEQEREDVELQLEAWERRMMDAAPAVEDKESDEESDELETFPDQDEPSAAALQDQEEGDADSIVSDETFSPQQGGTPAVLEAEVQLTQTDQEDQGTDEVEPLLETELIQNNVPEPSAFSVSDAQSESESEDVCPESPSTTVHLELLPPNSNEVPCLPAEPEEPVSCPTEENPPISEQMMEEDEEHQEMLSPSSADGRKVRFTIATAWQRSLSSEDGGEASCSPSASSVPAEPAATTLTQTVEATATAPAQPEQDVPLLSAEHVESTKGFLSKTQELTPASKESAVKVESCPDHPFGVRLRKTSVLSHLSLEEEPAEPGPSTVEPLQTVGDKPLIQPIPWKPALPKKPDVHGDSVVKPRRISEPCGASDGPSWISVAKQKQKLYKDHSLNEISGKKEEHDRKSSLPVSSSAAAGEHRPLTSDRDPCKASSLSAKEGRWITSLPTPVPPVSTKSLPVHSVPRTRVSPAAPQTPPHQDHTHPPSCSTTPSLPASRVSPGQTLSKAPELAPQRAVPPPSLPQSEPPWLALAKKKAKAWSEMPQIVQ